MLENIVETRMFPNDNDYPYANYRVISSSRRVITRGTSPVDGVEGVARGTILQRMRR